MDWTKISIDTTTPGIDHVCAALLALGIEGFIIEDAADFDAFLQNTTPHWDYIDESLLQKKEAPSRVIIYLPDTMEGKQTLHTIEARLQMLKGDLSPAEIGTLHIHTFNQSEEDWANNWKQYYKNIEIGDRLVISPLWEEVPPSLQAKTIIKMDPGMAFGTGAHETTRLCLSLLSQHVKGGETILDIGCGSGILGISALRLGAKSVQAIDIDPLAVQIAQENAATNNIDSSAFFSRAGNVLTDSDLQSTLAANPYDMIFANIVADVILPLLTPTYHWLKESGLLLVSGIIENRAAEIEAAALQAGFVLVDKQSENDWYSYVFAK